MGEVVLHHNLVSLTLPACAQSCQRRALRAHRHRTLLVLPPAPPCFISTLAVYSCKLGAAPQPSLHQASANGVGLRVDDGGLQAHRGCAVCSPHASFLMSNSGGGFAQMGQWEETVPGD